MRFTFYFISRYRSTTYKLFSQKSKSWHLLCNIYGKPNCSVRCSIGAINQAARNIVPQQGIIMSKLTIADYADLAISSTQSLRVASKDMVEFVLNGDTIANMQHVFFEFRNRYAEAKIDNASVAMKDISAAFRNATNGMRYWFGKEGMVAGWPNIRSGMGECELKTKKDSAADSKAKKAAQDEIDRRDAETAKAAKAADQVTQLRQMSAEELAESFAETIKASGLDPRKVMTELGAQFEIKLSRPRNSAAKKTA